MLMGVVPLYNFEDLKNHLFSETGIDFSKFNYVKIVESVAERGFRLFEITGDIYFFLPDSFSEDTLIKIRGLVNTKGYNFTVHLPIWSIEPSSPNKKIREASVDAIVETINHFEEIKPINYVMHTFGALASEFSRLKASDFVKNYILKFYQGFAAESLEQILDETGINPSRIAIETVEFPWELTYELVETYDTSICYDTGHLHSGQSGNYDPINFLETYFKKIIEIHLHDAIPRSNPDDYMYKDHLPLGVGTLPFCDFMKKLMEMGYNGSIVLELDINDALESIKKIEQSCGIKRSIMGVF